MPPRVAFVNGGILGLLSYATWLRHAFADEAEIHAEHFVLSEEPTTSERVVRRLLCTQLAPNVRGWNNVDLARYRIELNAGLQARRRLLARGLDRFDVLHFHRQATAYASLDLMERLPSIVSIDCTQTCVLQDAASDVERWSFGFNVRRDGEIFRRAAAIVSTSHWAASEVRRMYPDCGTPIHVMPKPVPLGLFDPSWPQARRARTDRRVQFMFMGGDFPRKGGYDLLEAWMQGRFFERADLTIVSDWPIDCDLPRGVRLAIGIRGETPEWIEVWRAADVFVMPTRNEAFGVVFQEAAAAGLPTIGTRLNAVPEIVEDGVTGLLVTPGNPAELARAMDSLLSPSSSSERRCEMGTAARRKIEIDANPDDHRRRLVAMISRATQAS